MINILMIAYEFPPLNSGGSHRPHKFAKNLHQHGIHPIVLTPKLESAHSGKHHDQLLLEEKTEMTILRTEVDAPKFYDKYLSSYYFNIVDISAARWRKNCILAVEEILKKHKIEAIYVTIPPFSMADLGREIAQKFRLPLILDMRDAWSHWVITPFASYLHYRLTLLRERKALNAATVVIGVSEQLIKDLERAHPLVDKNKFELITNAYDEEPPKYAAEMPIDKPSIDKPFKIGYVGSFYYTPYQRNLQFKPWWKKKPHQYLQYSPRKEDWLYRSPYFFFKALAAWRKQRPEMANLLQVDFVGAVPAWLEEMITEFDLKDIVRLLGPLPHKDALKFQDDCDALLLTSVKVLGGLDYCIAGKTYEYICRKKPILAVVTEGNQKSFIEKTGLGILCPPDDVDSSVAMLNKLVDGEVVLKPNQEFIESVNISVTTKKLADIVNNILKNKT